MAGISLSVTQYVRHYLADIPTPVGPFRLPILEISQQSSCPKADSPDCYTTDITVQMPFELIYYGSIYVASTEVVISENGVDSQAFGVSMAADQIHVVTGADNGLSVNGNLVGPILTHADGTLVSSQSLVQPGEVIIVYAWGLGNTIPSVKSGDVTPTPAPVVYHDGHYGVYVRLDFTPNAAPSRLYVDPQATAPAFLTPGQVGLYQVHVQLPSNFPPVVPCNPNAGLGAGTNLTITLFSSWSYDGASICLQAIR
jgi:uncharacterized protein (TIGR03437 family)